MLSRKILTMINIVLLAILLGLMVEVALTATTSKLTLLGVYEDGFYNFDFSSQWVSNANVDWPVTILFWGNANDIKIRYIYGGSGVPWKSPIYFYLLDDPNKGWEWDYDRGVKFIVNLGPWVTCSYPDLVVINFGYVYMHMRLYGSRHILYDALMVKYNYNPDWGKYVLATTHMDEFPFEKWSGYSEIAEWWFIVQARDKGYPVAFNWAYFWNDDRSECCITNPYADRDQHIWCQNGFVSVVRVD
jgi:hypothetical protein